MCRELTKWPVLPERKSYWNQVGEDEAQLSTFPCHLTVLSDFCHLHMVCEPGSVTQDLIFDEKFCLLFECLNLIPQTQRLTITVQKVSINHCKDCVTEGNDKIFWRLLGLYLPSSSFFPAKCGHLSCCGQTRMIPWYPQIHHWLAHG